MGPLRSQAITLEAVMKHKPRSLGATTLALVMARLGAGSFGMFAPPAVGAGYSWPQKKRKNQRKLRHRARRNR